MAYPPLGKAQHDMPHNLDDGFFATATFFESEIFVFEFGVLIRLADSEHDLNKERFQIRPARPIRVVFFLPALS